MYKATRMVSDFELASTHASEIVINKIRRWLFQKILHEFVQNNINIEDYFIRFTSRRDVIDHGGGIQEYATIYEINAIPIEEASVYLGGRRYSRSPEL